MTTTASDRLRELVQQFASAPKEIRLQALLDYSRRLPDFPDRLRQHSEALERVPECQTPFTLVVEESGDDTIALYFDVPAESPTVRGYAGILHETLDRAPAEQILEIPDDFYQRMGLEEVVSGLRLRGMGAILARLKRKVGELALDD